jgi:hypothetical protein
MANELMRGRTALLEKHRLGPPDIRAVMAQMRPLEGAREFLHALRARTQVAGGGALRHLLRVRRAAAKRAHTAKSSRR